MKIFLRKKLVRIKKVLTVMLTLAVSDKPVNILYENGFHISFYCLSYIRAAGGGFMRMFGLSLFHSFHPVHRFFCAFPLRLSSFKNSEI